MSQNIPREEILEIDREKQENIHERELTYDSGSLNKEKLDVEYGDIIQLISPSNSEYHEAMFFVNYIDETKAKLLNIATNQFIELAIRPDTTGFTDESILIVYLLDRSKTPGYARQKGLVTGIWVDIHFYKLPTITAEITNLEEDQIELTTYPALKILYIDFAYRGIPEDIPIEKFVIREKPATLKNASSLSLLREQVANEYDSDFGYINGDEPTQEFLPNGESITYIPDDAEPVENIKSILRDKYIKTQPKKKGVAFGEYLDVVEQFVEVAENKKRYNIDVQINSYMDELLSTIPYSARTNNIMTRIHILVERYKELREMYSEFDDAGNVKWLKKKDPNTHKPLIQHIEKMDMKLPWIVPIVTNIKNIYEDRELPLYDQADISKYDQDIVIYDEQQMIDDLFYNGSNEQNKYTNLYRQLNANFMTPMKMPLNENEIIHKIPVSITTEAFVENRRNIYSSTVKNGQLANHRFFQQTYTAPLTYMAKEQRFKEKNYYVKKSLIDSDEMAIQSLLTLPMPIMQYTRAFLPNTSLYDRVQLSSLVYIPSFFLNKKTDIKRVEINDFSKELDFEIKEEDNDKKKFQYLTTITQYILSSKLLEYKNTDNFEKFLQVVIPNAWTIIHFLRSKTKNHYSFRNIVSLLEPFMIYEKDISYTQYQHISYMIRKQIKEFKETLQAKRKEYDDYKKYKYQVAKKPELIPNIFSEKRELTDLLYSGYKFGGSLENPKEIKETNDEILQKILKTDDAELFTLLMQSMMILLVTPDSILKTEEPTETDWMDDGKSGEKCGIEVLAKKYMKIDDLLKDNGNEDVFFDKEFDQTNYGIMKKYEKEKKEMADEQKFADFLAENLVQKHDVNREKSAELAQILIAGKKRVSEGHYAVLEIAPKLPKDTDAPESSDNFEMEARTKYTYYIRKKSHWVHEESLDEMAFIDSNTLFCNLKSLKCIKNTDDKSADKACEFGPSYFYKLEREKVVKEFERRYDVTRDSLEKTLETKIIKQTRLASRIQTLLTIQREKSSLLAYHLGLRAQHLADDLVISPRAPLLRIIYGQKDFIERQHNIVKFVEKFCREPMIAEREEDPYWKYCIDTNTKLIPSFMYTLANEFVYFGQEAYASKLNEIISVQGIEEDGFIYDRHTHEVIKKIDNVQEDQYNEAGFRVITNAVIEQDIGAIIRDKLTKKQARVFENQLSEEIYRIYAALSAKIAPFSEEVWQKVNQLSTEFISNTKIIAEESAYNKKSQQDEKKTGKKAISYEKMRNKKMVQIVASVLLIIIQTSIPSFKGNKTFPGCVLSFEGFPLNGEENLQGIEYIACILKGISSADIKPWDSIHKTPVIMMKGQIKELIQKFMLVHPTITSMQEKKREYLAIASDNEDVPDEHRIEKWQQFMPPLKDVAITLQPISSGFVKEYWSLMRQGHKDQSKHELAMKSKLALYGYAIIDKIQDIVKTKTLLLKTSGNIPYLQNACCNEKTESKKAIKYFAEEDGSPIQQYILSVYELSKMLNNVHLITVASFVRNKFSFYPKPVMPTEIMEENMYSAFIYYCGLDRGKIPLEFRGFFAEIPENYNSNASLNEKIAIIKRTKRIDKEDMDHLMRIVRQRNAVHLVNQDVPNIIERFQDVLTAFDKDMDTVNVDPMLELDTKIRGSLRSLLDSYDPNKLYSIDMEVEQITHLDKLKRELNNANELLFKKIMKFMDKSLKMKKSVFEDISQFMASIHEWKIDSESSSSSNATKLPNYYDTAFYRVQQYFKNALYDLTHYFPALILNRRNENMALNYYEKGDDVRQMKTKNPNERIHKYWNLSRYDETDLKNTIKKYQHELYKFQEDEVIQDLISSIQPKLIDLNTWINEMPVFSSLLKDREYFHLFDKSCVQSLDMYLIYTTIYQYIKAASERVILQKERENAKQKRRGDISESRDPFLTGVSQQEIDEEILEDYEELDEMQMMADEGQQQELDQRVAKYLMVFLNMYKENKKKMDYTYSEIERNMNNERTKEKERIMKRFTKDDKGNEKKEDERKIEFAKKKLGLGIWNVGKQKSIFQYDKKTSDRERAEILQQQELQQGVEELVNEGLDVLEEGVMRTIEEIDEENGEDEVDEGFDIGDYNAENDGGYYAEDRGENEFNEDEF